MSTQEHMLIDVTDRIPDTIPAPAVQPLPEPEPVRYDVSVVLPVYNERGHVLQELERIKTGLDASPYTYEIIVIDDGSTDGTVELLHDLADIRLIELPQNRGSGYARKVGTRAALGEVVVWTDADMTYPNDRMAELVASLGNYDQVVGARTSEEGTHRWARVPAKWAIRKLACHLVETDIPDLNSGFRAFRRDAALPYLHLLPQGFSCVTTITMSFLANGHPVRYVPIDYAPRAGESKFHWRRDTSKYVMQVIRMIMTFNPLRVFMPIGGFLMLTAFGKLIYDVLDKGGRITSNAVILTIVAFQVIAIGLLADLVSKSISRRS